MRRFCEFVFRFRKLCGLCLAAYALATPMPADDFKVIAHVGLPVNEISAGDLRSIFLGTKTSLEDGSKVTPVMETNGAVLTAFAKTYLGKSGAALQAYYRSLVFTGKWSMPVAFATDSAVIAYVARTPGAIGYVRENVESDGVKVLKVR